MGSAEGTPNKRSLFETSYGSSERVAFDCNVTCNVEHIWQRHITQKTSGSLAARRVPPAARAIETSGALRNPEGILSNVTCNVEHIFYNQNYLLI